MKVGDKVRVNGRGKRLCSLISDGDIGVVILLEKHGSTIYDVKVLFADRPWPDGEPLNWWINPRYLELARCMFDA